MTMVFNLVQPETLNPSLRISSLSSLRVGTGFRKELKTRPVDGNQVATWVMQEMGDGVYEFG